MPSAARRGCLALLLLLTGELHSPAARALEVPPSGGRVNDLAGLLSDQFEANLERQLEELEQETGAQIAILTIPSLEDEILEDFSLRVAETWRLGRGQFDDGVLLLIARDERRMRLEVGYGLEGAIPDAYAKRVVDDIIRPRFRSGDYDGGVTLAVDAISGLVQGDESLPPTTEERQTRDTGTSAGGALAFLFFLVPVGLFSLQALAARGCAGWFLYVFLMPFWLIFPLAMLGRPIGFIPLMVWIIGYPILRVFARNLDLGKSTKHSGRGGTFWGTGGGWSSSGGGFGGGFSGGGGSFGGGGASGSW